MREHHLSIASTQRRACELARSGAPPGTTVSADSQTDGHGRLDHAWASPPGGVYFSRIEAERSGPDPFVPLAVGVEILDVLHDRFGAPLKLKWPNDLLWMDGSRAKKLGGILVDRVAHPPAPGLLVVGVGINVLGDDPALPASLRGKVAWLRQAPRPPESPAQVRELAESAVVRAVNALGSEPDRSNLLAACRASLYGLGQPARLDGRPAGVIRGVAPDGALVLEQGGVGQLARAGELEVEGP